MPPEPPLPIVAIVRDDERDGILAAANRLSLCLAERPPPGRPIRLRFVAPDAALPPEPAAAVIASLRIDEDARDAAFGIVADRWRARLAAYRAAGPGAILLVNIFRHVADPVLRPLLAPHIRRLNLLAVDLSRESGAGIADLDRTFALIGARTSRTDYRLQGELAREIAAHGLVAAILLAGLDGHVAGALQEAARHRNDASIAANLARLGRDAA